MTRCARVGMIGLWIAIVAAGCGGAETLKELHRSRSGSLDVVVLSPRDTLKHGKDDFVVEFRAADGQLVDVGDVRASANMPMPGMPMFSSLVVKRSEVPGRYRVDGDFSMVGTWRLTVEWDGPRGKGMVTFSGSVQ